MAPAAAKPFLESHGHHGSCAILLRVPLDEACLAIVLLRHTIIFRLASHDFGRPAALSVSEAAEPIPVWRKAFRTVGSARHRAAPFSASHHKKALPLGKILRG